MMMVPVEDLVDSIPKVLGRMGTGFDEIGEVSLFCMGEKLVVAGGKCFKTGTSSRSAGSTPKVFSTATHGSEAAECRCEPWFWRR
jgi:hypothetical protein